MTAGRTRGQGDQEEPKSSATRAEPVVSSLRHRDSRRLMWKPFFLKMWIYLSPWAPQKTKLASQGQSSIRKAAGLALSSHWQGFTLVRWISSLLLVVYFSWAACCLGSITSSCPSGLLNQRLISFLLVNLPLPLAIFAEHATKKKEVAPHAYKSRMETGSS